MSLFSSLDPSLRGPRGVFVEAAPPKRKDRIESRAAMKIERIASSLRACVPDLCLRFSGERTKFAANLTRDEGELLLSMLTENLRDELRQRDLAQRCPMCHRDGSKGAADPLCASCFTKLPEGMRAAWARMGTPELRDQWLWEVLAIWNQRAAGGKDAAQGGATAAAITSTSKVRHGWPDSKTR